MIRLAAVLAFAVVLPALPANARLLDDQHEHDGFFLRFHLGGGSMSARWDGPQDFSYSGPGGTFAFSLGGAFAPNLILFGEITSDAVSNPRFESEIRSDSTRDTVLRVLGFGPGLTYYFMPVNLYLSGSVLLMRATVDEPFQVEESDQGMGLKLAVGKEWWVSRDWGLGVAAFGTFGRIPHAKATIGASNVGIAFTATYN
ncbi:MAG TPA: hypothetical protein VN033_09110 [Vulgatibacter sp.]|nr:hypothetical protein [Vulgatibacter sp.]